MTPLQKLQCSVARLQDAGILELRDIAVDALGNIIELAAEMVSDAEMSNQLLQNEIDELSERVKRLEACEQSGESSRKSKQVTNLSVS